MVKLRPLARHRSSSHRAKSSRLGKREVDVPDDREEHQDERNVVQENADLAEQSRKLEREPHRNSSQQETDRREIDGIEQHLLPAVVLPTLRRRLIFPFEILNQLRSEPAL